MEIALQKFDLQQYLGAFHSLAREGARTFVFRGVTPLALETASEAQKRYGSFPGLSIILSDRDLRWASLPNFRSPDAACAEGCDAVFVFSTVHVRQIIDEVKHTGAASNIVYVRPRPAADVKGVEEKTWERAKELIRELARRAGTGRPETLRDVIGTSGLKQPNFLIIGAQKAATSWLHEMLSQHPEVYMPKRKELEAFSYMTDEQEWSERYLLTLVEHFSGVKDEKMVGEATPSYFWNANVHPEWMKRPAGFNSDIPETVLSTLGPDVKLILSLRDPVDRAVSAYFHHLAWGAVSPTQSLVEAGDYNGIVHMGFYHAHLQEWLKYFPMENILVLGYERAMAEPVRTLDRVYEFLGISGGHYPPAPEKVVHGGVKRKKIDGAYCISRADYEKYLARRGEMDTKETLAACNGWAPLFDEYDTAKLREIYREDTNRLRDLLGEELFA